jgi:hypothetical protein
MPLVALAAHVQHMDATAGELRAHGFAAAPQAGIRPSGLREAMPN